MGAFHAFLGEDRVPFVANALRHVSDWISIIQKDGQNLSSLHRLQLELGFDKVVGTDYSSEVQLRVSLDGNGSLVSVGWVTGTHSSLGG